MGKIKYLLIVSILLLSGCVPSQALWENYRQHSTHKAYALGDNNVAGAAWNQKTQLEAQHLALSYCKTSGGVNCKIIDVNGSAPKEGNTSSLKSTEIESSKGKRILESSGTGFFVNKNTLITNYHVAESCEEKTALINGEEFVLYPVASDLINDVAIFQTEKEIDKVAVLRGVPKIKKGEEVAVYGYPLSGLLSAEAKITNGIINSTSGLANDIRYLQFSAPVQSGNSGGPLIDESGAVIGIITATLNPKYLEMIGSNEPQNVNFAIKSSLLLDILEQAGISYTTPNQNQKRTAAEIADEADGYTARVLCWK